jgi:hypothetical protein
MRRHPANPPSRSRSETPRMTLTDHAWQRMTSRGISTGDVAVVLEYGRTVHARGAEISVIGRKEVEEYSKAGINLSPYVGIHVLCSRQGSVLTTYRNRDNLNLKTYRTGPGRSRFKR